ncbi:hypothetical protein MRX96_003128 [Rhipicephalus microplus]
MGPITTEAVIRHRLLLLRHLSCRRAKTRWSRRTSIGAFTWAGWRANHVCLEIRLVAMHYKGAPLKNRWGFIEDARRQICRPSKLQQEHYSGHKRFHCQKIRLLCILKDTRFYENIVKVARGNKYVIHGDPVYPLKPLLLKPYGGARLQLHQTHFNKCMSTVRQAVELGIGKVAADFAL